MKKGNKTIDKSNLPQKICVTCGRPFMWRKKWELVWEEVKFCSDACRKTKKAHTPKTDEGLFLF